MNPVTSNNTHVQHNYNVTDTKKIIFQFVLAFHNNPCYFMKTQNMFKYKLLFITSNHRPILHAYKYI